MSTAYRAGFSISYGKLRQIILERYENGWMPKAGRCKKYKHNSLIAGKISVDGTWELKTAKYFDSLGVKWKRNTKRFKYINLEGKVSHYTPDFWIDDWDTYIEVKGYKTELDDCKWKQFTEKLEVWDKNKLTELKIIGKYINGDK